jgi:hypothetical protein
MWVFNAGYGVALAYFNYIRKNVTVDLLQDKEYLYLIRSLISPAHVHQVYKARIEACPVHYLV